MSMSTPGGAPERVPSTVSTDKKPPAGAKPAGTKPGGARPGAGKSGGKGPRKPVTPVKVNQGRNWGPILVTGAVILLALGIIGWAGFASVQGTRSWQDRAADIDGITNYFKTDAELVKGGQHQTEPVKYTVNPPVAGAHNPVIQNCMGDIYTAPIANEHAVHSLEHGAVWVTYKLGMPEDQVAKLAAKVQGKEKMFMSPVEGLDKNVSLQAWGYQLKLDTVDDPRIDEFIKTLRVNASIEGPTATCDGGVTATGTAPQGAQTGS
jgi:hypothetical protein